MKKCPCMSKIFPKSIILQVVHITVRSCVFMLSRRENYFAQAPWSLRSKRKLISFLDVTATPMATSMTRYHTTRKPAKFGQGLPLLNFDLHKFSLQCQFRLNLNYRFI